MATQIELKNANGIGSEVILKNPDSNNGGGKTLDVSKLCQKNGIYSTVDLSRGQSLSDALNEASGGVLDLGNYTYEYEEPISVSFKGVIISNNATFKYTGTDFAPKAFELIMLGDVTIEGKLTFDGGLNCAKVLYVGNNTDIGRDFVAPYITCRNAVKKTSDYATGLCAEGYFEKFDVTHGLFEEISMEIGSQATPGAVGCIIKASSSTRYPRRVYINNATAKNIYAEGYSYQGDQDGFRIFGPDGADTTHPHKLEVFAHNITGVNCMGRTLKTQCDYIESTGIYIERNVNDNLAPWGIDVDIQTGGGFIRGIQAVYRESVPISTILVNSTISGYLDLPTCSVDDVQITNLTIISLREVVLIGSRGTDKPPQAFISKLRVIGLLDGFVRSSPLTGTERLTIDIDGAVGSPSVGAFITDASSSTGKVFARGIRNLGSDTTPFWRRSSSGQVYEISAIDCLGWKKDKRVILGTDNIAPTRLGRVAPEEGTKCGTEILLSKELLNDETWELPAQGWNNDSLYFIKIGNGNNDFAIISTNSANITDIALGSSVETGTTTEPTIGNYRIWTSSDGLRVSNRSGSTRQVTIKAIG